MAIASKQVTYTPFNKTSWGFVVGDLSGTHSGLTNAKVVITLKSGTNQWDETGHISTVGSGAAVASYNKAQTEWTCSGPLADVDAVLVALNLFPADFEAIRNWSATTTKPNATNGTYAQENPADTVAIPNTLFDLKVYDADNVAGGSTDYVITFVANQPTFGKQRPYWSVVPTDEDAGAGLHDSVVGGLLNLGTVLQGSDTDPLTVTCEFRHYDTSTRYDGGVYGQFSGDSDMFIGDKKPATRDTATNRLNFTGTKAEVQSYLNSVRYYRQSNKLAFDMFFTISNGVVGSTLTKTIWYSDNVIGLTTVPEQEYDEDTAGPWDFGALVTSSVPADVDSFKATITVPTAAASNITSSTAGVTQSYTDSTGVYEVSHSSEATLLTALRNITFTPETDYDVDFNMTVQLTYTGSAISSSYTSASQTVTVSIDEKAEEMGNTSSDHTYVEDNAYSFITNPALPQIIHNTNSNFTITFTLSPGAGSLKKSGTAATLTSVGNGVYTLAGTRDNVNADILTLQYLPAPDFNADHTISFSSIRTSGTGTPPTTTGEFIMTGTPVGEYSITQLLNQTWDEDVTQVFNSGLQITDTADEIEGGAAFGSHYIIACEMYEGPGGPYTDGSLSVASASQGSLTISATNGQGGDGQFGGNAFTISGTKSEVNTAMQNLEFTPNPNFEGDGPWVWYYIKRVSDNVYLTPLTATGYSYPTEVVSKFLSASNTAEFRITKQTITWEENVTRQFDSGIEILDRVTENPKYSTAPNAFFGTEYKLETWMVDDIANPTSSFFNHGTLSTATPGNLNITGTGRGSTDLVMTGSKADLNAALKTMKFIPDVDYFGAGPVVFYKISRLYDDPDFAIVSVGDAASTTFATNTATTNFVITVPSNISWNEDQVLSFNSGVVITDKATENVDHADYFGTQYEVEARAKHNKTLSAGAFVVGLSSTIVSVGNTDFTAIGASANTVGVTFTPTGVGSGTGTAYASQPMNEGVWNCTDTGGSAISGIGTDASRLIITGTKAQVNTAMANMKMVPHLDMTTPNLSNTTIWFEYKITRKHDSIVYNNYTSGATNFNLGTAIDPYVTTVSPAMAYNEDIPTKIFEGKSVGVTETATADPLHNGNPVTYQVEVEISPNADGQWGTTGSSTYVTAVGTSTEVNAELQALVFTPTLDSSNNPSILYKQTRYRSGDSDLVQANGTVNIGTVTGTADPSYVHAVTPGMTFLEGTVTSLFQGKTIGISETLDVSNYQNFDNVSYTVEIKLDPSTDAWFTYLEDVYVNGVHTPNQGPEDFTNPPAEDGYNGSSLKIRRLPIQADDSYLSVLNEGARALRLTGSKTAINWAIQRLRVRPAADENINFNVLYSQTRHLRGIGDTVQATQVNIGEAVGTDFPEFIYGTSNNNTQYWVIPDNVNGVNTSASVADIISGGANVLLTPRQLATNLGEPYERPITITDSTVGAQYKIVFEPGTFNLQNSELNIMDTGWQTKADLHSIIEDGIYVNYKYEAGVDMSNIPDVFSRLFEGRTDLNIPDHNTIKTFNFSIYKRTYVGSETQIANGQLNYKFLTSPTLWHVGTTWNSLMELTSINETQYIYSDNPDLNVVRNLPNVTVSKGNKRYWHALSDRLLYKTLTGRWDFTTVPHAENNINLILGLAQTIPARLSGTEAGAIQHYISGQYTQYQSISDFKFYRQDFRGILPPGTYGPSGFPVSSYMDVIEKEYGPLIQPHASTTNDEFKISPINLIAYTDWGVMVVHRNINLNLVD